MPELPFDPISEAARQWRKHWGASAVPSMVAVTSIMRTEQILTARLNEVLKPWALTFPRYEALMLLFYSRNGSLPLGKMGERLQVHPTSITNTIDGLQKLGYAERTRHEEDRRKWLASITERGRVVAAEATEAINAARFGTAPLKRAQLQDLSAILRELRDDADDLGS
ncbi:MarR family winged helix-turn-helix transcriptional regulator [Baekduia sp. Peel2402]|uniref:MarR family winged helix-turn-helix transcriptional regulator n=1 Tax=Baekduia sp. Peel2402 TaxID=3458296 RepID=UPI00403E9C17